MKKDKQINNRKIRIEKAMKEAVYFFSFGKSLINGFSLNSELHSSKS